MSGVPHDLRYEIVVSAYTDDVNVSKHNRIELIDDVLKEYEPATGAKINSEMLVGFQLSTLRGKHMLTA